MDVIDEDAPDIEIELLRLELERRAGRLTFKECVWKSCELHADRILSTRQDVCDELLQRIIAGKVYDTSLRRGWVTRNLRPPRIQTHTSGPPGGPQVVVRRRVPVQVPDRELTEQLGKQEVTPDFFKWWLEVLSIPIAISQQQAKLRIAPPTDMKSQTNAGDVEGQDCTTDASVAAAARQVPPAIDCAFKRSGHVWQLSFAKETQHVPHVLGLVYIAELLRNPHVEIAALDLSGKVGSTGSLVQAGIPTTDDKTIAEVNRERDRLLKELAGICPEESERRRKLKEDIGQYEQYLRRGSDRRGRPRIEGGAAERARLAVTNAIKHAIKEILLVHPNLGHHLEVSIKTGVKVRYEPRQRIDWRIVIDENPSRGK